MVWDLPLQGDPGGPSSISGTAPLRLDAIFYIDPSFAFVAHADRARLRERRRANVTPQVLTRLAVVDGRSLDSVVGLRGRMEAFAGPAVDRVSGKDNPSGAPLEGQWPAGRPLDFVGEQAVDQLDVHIVEARP